MTAMPRTTRIRPLFLIAQVRKHGRAGVLPKKLGKVIL
jgi:hypothetical protein